MGFRRFFLDLALVGYVAGSASPAQIDSFPHAERFDSVATPSLPPGWSTSSNRLASGDFFSTSSSPHSSPNAAQSTNSTIPQSITSPAFDFSNHFPDRLKFWIARSGTHTSPLVVEASLDNGSSFPSILGDTLRNPGVTGYVQTVLCLPDSFFNQLVRFRWRLLGGTGGTAGTFRLDDMEISVLTSYDLAIGSGVIDPPQPSSTTPLSLSFTIRNDGALPSPQTSVSFFLDNNDDHTADSGEQFDGIPLISLFPGDSTALSVSHPPLSQGSRRFLAVIRFPADENPSNDTSEVEVNVGVSAGTIVVNEIMYAPSGDEPEWVELFNTSNDGVNLRNWRISDNNTTSKTVIVRSDFLIAPHSFALVAKDSTILTIHPGITVPVISANLPALNNITSDAVVIFDERILTIDSVQYFPDGQSGRSLERADPFSLSNDHSNWSRSLDSAGSTPGTVNSTIRHDSDLALGEIRSSGNILSIIVTNAGKETVSSYSLRLFADLNGNGIPEEPEWIGSIPSYGPLPPRGSAFLSYDWSALPSGETTLILLLDLASDQQPSNNVKAVTVEQHFLRGALLINEIMYEPPSDKAEWFEIYNPGNVPIDLRRWTFSDASASPLVVTGTSAIVQPSGFAVVASDSTIYDFSPFPSPVPVLILNKAAGLGLGNEGDDLVIRDGTGTSIDSVRYSPTWHQPALTETRGRSLERINPELDSNNPDNWSTSAGPAGGSPGLRNTIFTSRVSSAGALSFSPNPFSPDRDGFEDFCLISYRLPRTTALIRVTIFDLHGRLIRTLVNSGLSGDHGEVLWDGLDDQGRQTRIGPYIILLEAVDGTGGSVAVMKGVIVVATRL